VAAGDEFCGAVRSNPSTHSPPSTRSRSGSQSTMAVWEATAARSWPFVSGWRRPPASVVARPTARRGGASRRR